MADPRDRCPDCGDEDHHGCGRSPRTISAEQIHSDGIKDICEALMSSGLWQEIDGDGTEYSIIADHITQLVQELADLSEEVERHRRANLVRAVIDGWDESLDGALTDYINEHGWDAVPWKISERVAATHGGVPAPEEL